MLGKEFFTFYLPKMQETYCTYTFHTWTDHKTNTDISNELNITPLLDKIQDYKIKWIQHMNRNPRNRLQRLIKENAHQKTKGKKEGQSRDFWRCETGTSQQVTHVLDSYMKMMMMTTDIFITIYSISYLVTVYKYI
jgi:hypothetical protein